MTRIITGETVKATKHDRDEPDPDRVGRLVCYSSGAPKSETRDRLAVDHEMLLAQFQRGREISGLVLPA